MQRALVFGARNTATSDQWGGANARVLPTNEQRETRSHLGQIVCAELDSYSRCMVDVIDVDVLCSPGNPMLRDYDSPSVSVLPSNQAT
jgi:hypothetical protein